MKLDEKLKRIQDKLQFMLNRFLILQKENEKLKQELGQLRKMDIEKNIRIDSLLQKVEILKSTRSEMTEEEKKLFEKRINHYLKEVEKCIIFLQE